MHIGRAIELGNSSSGQLHAISIIGTWFERIRGTVIQARGDTNGLRLIDSYFEHCGTDVQPEIDLKTRRGQSMRQVFVRNCQFGDPGWQDSITAPKIWYLVPSRIRHGDGLSLVAEDNAVVLDGPGGQNVPFISTKGQMFQVEIVSRRNRYRTLGFPDDRQATHSHPNHPALDVEAHPMSGVVSPDSSCPQP